MNKLCQQHGLTQLINEPTHYTEQTSSIIDLIFVSNRNTVLLSGAGEPLLDQTVWYHCPGFVTLKFTKPKCKTFYRHMWRNDIGDYLKLRQLMSDTNWNLLKCDNVDIYAENITKTIIKLSSICIPNKTICIRSRDLPWMNNNIKKKIRQRKRLYQKAKTINSDLQWSNFRHVRNEVVLLLRNSKIEYFNNIARKLKSSDLCAKDWWKTLRTFIPTNTTNTIPPLYDEQTNIFVVDDTGKADMLNKYFASQCSLDENNHALPSMHHANANTLQSIHITQ